MPGACARQSEARSAHLTSLREAENFAEGAGKSSAQDRLRYFHSARGSANEVAAVLDVALAFQAVDRSLHDETVDLADQLAAMLARFR